MLCLAIGSCLLLIILPGDKKLWGKFWFPGSCRVCKEATMVAQAVWAGIWTLHWKIQRSNPAVNWRGYWMVHRFHIPEGWKVGCNSCRRRIFSPSDCKPYWVHQSWLAASREGHEESQRAAEDPKEQPDTNWGQEQSRGGGVICKEECSSDWGILWRLSAWHGILRKMTSLLLFVFFPASSLYA